MTVTETTVTCGFCAQAFEENRGQSACRLCPLTEACRFLRCPHCGYDIRGLPTDPEDGATICPECGCAWQLDGKAE